MPDISRSRWPRGLKRRSADVWLLGLQVGIPVEDMEVCLLCVYVVLSCVGRGLCDGLITRPEESYRVCQSVCDQEASVQRRTAQIWAVGL
jgi:hypothetical protein